MSVHKEHKHVLSSGPRYFGFLGWRCSGRLPHERVSLNFWVIMPEPGFFLRDDPVQETITFCITTREKFHRRRHALCLLDVRQQPRDPS